MPGPGPGTRRQLVLPTAENIADVTMPADEVDPNDIPVSLRLDIRTGLKLDGKMMQVEIESDHWVTLVLQHASVESLKDLAKCNGVSWNGTKADIFARILRGLTKE